MDDRIITLIGGTGFVGRYVTRALAKAGWRLRVVSRRPNAALALKTAGVLGQIALLPGDITKPETLLPSITGSHAVVDLAGVLFERGRQKFTALHAQGAEKLAQMATAAGVQAFIYVSALGVDRAHGSAYARSKALGEKAVQGAFPGAVVLRPSVIFGPEDDFFNRFARLAKFSPALPLVGGGRTRFQPVYAGDVAEAVRACLDIPAAAGQIFELGGPEIFTFRQILDYVLAQTGRKRWLAPLPFPLAGLLAAFTEWLPRPPLTRDQVRLLRTDNVVDPEALGFSALGIAPTAVDTVVPDYLAQYHPQPYLTPEGIAV